MKWILAILMLVASVCHSADCHRIVPFILKWEGGFALLPNDPGGQTNKGVTWWTWQKFYGKTHDEFLHMPADKWEYIYKVGYWDVMHGDEIKSQDIAEILAEWCWGSGTSVPAKAVQRALGLRADGVMGEATVAAINAADQETLYQTLITDRFRFLAHIPYYTPTNWAYIDGWLNRMTDLVFYQKEHDHE